MDLDLDAPGLIGRAAVWADLLTVLEPVRPRTPAALLIGPAGIGKSALVAAFAREAARRGHTVARASGGDDTKPYAGLRALLPDAEPDLAALPAGQRRALRLALDGTEHDVDLLALRSAVAAVLALRADDLPVTLIVDDVDRIDPPTADLLLTLAAAITWRQVPVVALFAARTENAPAELSDLLPHIPVPELTERESERLLGRMPGTPSGTARLELLRRAAGNPLALREFADWAERPGVVRAFDRRVRSLPANTLRALTLAAAGERDLGVIARADPAATPAAWQPAEDAGLVVVADGTARFVHPLVEQTVLEVVDPADRNSAHRALAAVSTDPNRALWHRAAATEDPDPELAGELIGAAGQLDGAGTVTAIGLLERAAPLLPRNQRVPVFLEATLRAAAVGRVSWAMEIMDRARMAIVAETPPDVLLNLTQLSSWLLTMRGRLDESSALLISALRSSESAATMKHLFVTAGLPAFLIGESPLASTLRETIAQAPLEPATLFARAVVAPTDRVRAAVLAVPAPVSMTSYPVEPSIGAAAMLLDEPEQALRLLGPAVRMVLDGVANGVYLTAPGAACYALMDLGRWVEAEQCLAPVLSLSITAEAVAVHGGAYSQLAVITLSQGRRDDAAALLERSNDWITPGLAVRLRQAQAQAAAAAGQHEEAYRLLSGALSGPGAHFWQILLLPDLIAAAIHIGRLEEARRLCTAVRERFAGRWFSQRLRNRIAAADALADPDPAAAAARLTVVVDNEASRLRPFERAVLAVELAGRWRRTGQPRRAGEVLIDALDTFERLGAPGWAGRVRGELRGEAPAEPAVDPFARLSAQQEQIARLAAEGLSDREIAARLYLSVRTVSSHLYRMYPLLGVANRTQLADLARAYDGRAR